MSDSATHAASRQTSNMTISNIIFCTLSIIFSVSIYPMVSHAREFSDEGNLINCVDSCIIELARLLNRNLTHSELIIAIEEVGLNATATSRTLSDCQSILKQVGISTTAIRLNLEQDSQLLSHGIIYLPPVATVHAGHVVVFSRNANSNFRIYDPAMKSVDSSAFRLKDLPELSANNICLVPDHNLDKLKAMIKCMFNSLCCALFGTGVAFLFFAYRLLAARPYRWRVLNFLMLSSPIMVSFISCSKSDDINPLVVINSEHNYGVIVVEDGQRSLDHTFVVKNLGSFPISFSATASSCSCMVAEGTEEEIRIQPGGSVDLPITINITSKIGYFRESITLRSVDELTRNQEVSLTGFLQRRPIPSSELVLLRYGVDGVASGEALVRYFRPRDGQPAILDDSEPQLISSNDHAHVQNQSFMIGSPSHSDSESGSNGIIDVWKYPVTYRFSGEMSNNAKLVITWKYPKCQTVFNLLAEPLPPIEVLQNHIYLAPIKMGTVSVESLPMRVNDKNIASNAVFKSDNSNISAKTDLEHHCILLTIKAANPGPFSGLLRISTGSQPEISLKIDGVVHER